MASREAPLPGNQESIFTGHGKEGLSHREKRDFF